MQQLLFILFKWKYHIHLIVFTNCYGNGKIIPYPSLQGAGEQLSNFLVLASLFFKVERTRAQTLLRARSDNHTNRKCDRYPLEHFSNRVSWKGWWHWFSVSLGVFRVSGLLISSCEQNHVFTPVCWI